MSRITRFRLTRSSCSRRSSWSRGLPYRCLLVVNDVLRGQVWILTDGYCDGDKHTSLRVRAKIQRQCTDVLFKISRSLRSSRFSLRRRASSSRSAVVRPVQPCVRSARAWSTHLRSADSVRPRSLGDGRNRFVLTEHQANRVSFEVVIELASVAGAWACLPSVGTSYPPSEMSTQPDHAQGAVPRSTPHSGDAPAFTRRRSADDHGDAWPQSGQSDAEHVQPRAARPADRRCRLTPFFPVRVLIWVSAVRNRTADARFSEGFW